MENMKEVVRVLRAYCPHCEKDVTIHVMNPYTKYETVDVEKVEDNKYGVQARWKEVYVCPYCGEKFYFVCEH